MKSYQEELCAVYGIPRSMIGESDRNGLSAGVKNNRDVFFQTISRLSKNLSAILEKMYVCMFSEEECQFLVDESLEKIGKNNLTKTMVKKIVDSNRVHIEFPILPHETQEGLLTKYILDVIDFPTFANYSTQLSGMPDHGTFKDAKGLSDQEKKTVAFNLKTSILKGTGFSIKPEKEEKREGGEKKKKRKKEGERAAGEDKKQKKEKTETRDLNE